MPAHMRKKKLFANQWLVLLCSMALAEKTHRSSLFEPT